MQRKGRSMLGWDSLWWTMLYRGVWPSSTRPRLKSRKRGGEWAKEIEAGKREKLQRKTLARRGDLREAQWKTKAEEGTLAR